MSTSATASEIQMNQELIALMQLLRLVQGKKHVEKHKLEKNAAARIEKAKRRIRSLPLPKHYHEGEVPTESEDKKVTNTQVMSMLIPLLRKKIAQALYDLGKKNPAKAKKIEDLLRRLSRGSVQQTKKKLPSAAEMQKERAQQKAYSARIKAQLAKIPHYQ